MKKDHMVVNHIPGARWTCGRMLDGQMLYLVEGDLIEAGIAERLFLLAESAWTSDILIKVMLHPSSEVRLESLVPTQCNGQRLLTFDFIKLCFEALHSDRGHHHEVAFNASIGV